MSIKTLNFSKAGNRQEESEDSLAINSERERYSVCDGASDSIFSGWWASCLAGEFVDGDYNLDNGSEYFQMLLNARKKWYSGINWNRLPWNVKNKSIRGSYCTFMGVQLVRDDSLYCNAWAVGDSCFFIDDGKSLQSFPVSSPEDFGVHPDLVWSGYGHPMNERKEYVPEYKVKSFKSEIENCKRIVLATDALSKYILENGAESIDRIWENSSSREFFDKLRSDGSIKNDDLSAIIISFS